MRTTIKKAIREQKVTQDELSSALGIRQASISEYLSGKSQMYSDNLEKICEYLGLKLS